MMGSNGDGRPPPKRMKGKMSASVMQPWLAGARQYASWMYAEHALVYEFGGQGQILPARLDIGSSGIHGISLPWFHHMQGVRGVAVKPA